MPNDKKIPNVPNLRLVEFNKVFDFLSTNSFSRDELNYNYGEYKNIHYGDILINYGTVKNVDDSDVPFINKNIKIAKSLDLLLSGDIIIADTAEDYASGKALEVVNSNKIKILSGLHTIAIRPKQYFYPGYLGFYMNSKHFRKQILPLIQGTKVYSISKASLLRTKILIPDEEKQKFIAKLLLKSEARIRTQIKIIEDYILLRKNLNNLFFDSLKNKVKFDSIYKIASEGGTPNTSNSKYYSGGQIPFIKIENLYNKYIVNCNNFITEEGLKNSSAWLVPKNSILLSNGATIGETAINKIDVATKQGILGIIPSVDYDVEFLYYLFKSNRFIRMLKRITTKGTMDAAYLKDLNQEYIYVCSKNEHKNHVIHMSKLDMLIDIQKQILSKYIINKKYLLQNLFI